MRFIMVPVLLSLAYIGFEHREEILDQYRAAYPADPVKRAVLEECARVKNFNRLDSIDRQNCYTGNLGNAPVGLAATPSPYYAYSPSHLPGNDVRRQEANDSYQLGGLISSATAAPVAKPAAQQSAPAISARPALAPPAPRSPHPAAAHHASYTTKQAWQSR